jgi:hypothetical protein
MNTDVNASSWIRTHDPNVQAGEDGSCLRPRSHCDRHNPIVTSRNSVLNKREIQVLWVIKWHRQYRDNIALGDCWIGTDLEGSGRGLIQVLFRNFLGVTKKNHDNLRTTDELVEIRTETQVNINFKKMHYINSFHKKDDNWRQRDCPTHRQKHYDLHAAIYRRTVLP